MPWPKGMSWDIKETSGNQLDMDNMFRLPIPDIPDLGHSMDPFFGKPQLQALVELKRQQPGDSVSTSSKPNDAAGWR